MVSTIFVMAADGVGITAIARYLNEQAVPTPIQLKQWISDNFISTPEYKVRKSKLEQEVSAPRDIVANPGGNLRLYYEKYVLNEITFPEFMEARNRIREAKECLDAAVRAANEYEQLHQYFKMMLKAPDKELSLVEIVNCIKKIVITKRRQVDIE